MRLFMAKCLFYMATRGRQDKEETGILMGKEEMRTCVKEIGGLKEDLRVLWRAFDGEKGRRGSLGSSLSAGSASGVGVGIQDPRGGEVAQGGVNMAVVGRVVEEGGNTNSGHPVRTDDTREVRRRLDRLGVDLDGYEKVALKALSMANLRSV